MQINIYIDDGRVFSYEVANKAKLREHAHAIVQTGYRSDNEEGFTHYPPHRILKVTGPPSVDTQYVDTARGT